MRRTAGLFGALLIIGLGLATLPGIVSAENYSWEINEDFVPELKKPGMGVYSLDLSGGFIGFACIKNESISDFTAVVSEKPENRYEPGTYTVRVTIDHSTELTSTWQEAPRPNRDLGLALGGQPAYDLAQAIARAKRRIMVRTPRGIISNDLNGAASAITQLLKFCQIS